MPIQMLVLPLSAKGQLEMTFRRNSRTILWYLRDNSSVSLCRSLESVFITDVVGVVFVLGEALSKAFASSDIFVMPSDTETLGFVVMEALASGTPVVGVAAGGVVDIIEDSHTGYLAENADDMEEFSQKVKVLIENPTLRSNLSSNAVHWAKKWSWEAATSKLRNVQYRKAIALHRSRDHKGRFYPEVVQAIMNASSISPII